MANAIQSLNTDSFLRLFVTQLQRQDPTQPMDANQMMSELAQLTSVQKMTEMSETFSAAYQTERMSLANNLIGSEVTYATEAGLVTGVVEGAMANDGVVGVSVGGLFVDIDDIKGIRALSGTSTQN